MSLLVFTAPATVSGQLPIRAPRERPLEALLFMVPVPEERDADSAYAVELATHMRERFGRWHRHEATLIEFCEATESCGALVPDTSAYYYARSVGADFYVFGSISRTPFPRVQLQIYETGRRGGIRHRLATIDVRAESDVAAQSLAGMVNGILGDTLGQGIAAARDARDCWTKVVDRDYVSATSDAMHSLERFPNHPSAASCLAYIYGATGKRDSVRWALEKAAAGDASLTHVWERLGEEYLGVGDTARAVDARLREVSTDPDDMQRRVRIARLMDELGRRGAAFDLLSEGVERAGNNIELRRLLVRMCMQYEMWECAIQNMGALYALDSTLVGDTTFYFQMIGLAQAVADPDVAIWWTEEAVGQLDSLVGVAWAKVEEQRRAAERVEDVWYSLRLSHAGTLRDIGRKDSARVVYEGILEDDPWNPRAALAMARMLTDGRGFGPGDLSPADSQVLRAADSLLDGVAQHSDVAAVLQTVGISYFDVGSRLLRNRGAADLAVYWLERALQHDPDSTLAARGNAMLAVALAYLVDDADLQLRAAPSCELVDVEAGLIDRGLAAVEGAGPEFVETVAEVGSGLRAYVELIPQMREVLGCDGLRTPRE